MSFNLGKIPININATFGPIIKEITREKKSFQNAIESAAVFTHFFFLQ